MAVNPWKAPSEVVELLEKVKTLHHPRLEMARFAVCFNDNKPFIQNKLNLGKISKFSPLSKLWQGQQYDFCLSIPMDLWHSILKEDQKEAYLDLCLTRCTVEYKPDEIEENGKKKVIKDEWGRIQYTTEIKTDDDGNPKWKIEPMGIEVYIENISRYGLWMDTFQELSQTITDAIEWPPKNE